jgi:hypothetical protein
LLLIGCLASLIFILLTEEEPKLQSQIQAQLEEIEHNQGRAIKTQLLGLLPQDTKDQIVYMSSVARDYFEELKKKIRDFQEKK